MRLLISLFLLSSFVQRSQGEREKWYENSVGGKLKGGLPDGSLVTVFLKKATPAGKDTGIIVDFFEDVNRGFGRLHFRFYYFKNDGKNVKALLASNVAWTHSGVENFIQSDEENPITYVYPNAENDVYWRFDVYKINETSYLPFIQGCSANVRTMKGVKDSTDVHISSSKDTNFDKTDVYMTFRPASATSPPNIVMAAFNQEFIAKNRGHPTYFTDVQFVVNRKIKLSALMLSTPSNHADKETDIDKNHAALYFLAADGKWAFGICNKYKAVEKKVKLYLFAISSMPDILTDISQLGSNIIDCTGAGSSSTDIVHVKLERSTDSLIKMRIYFKGDALSQMCQIDVGTEGAPHLNGKLMVKGVQSATLLHLVNV